MQRQNGFFWLEAVIVLCVLGILAGLVVPNYLAARKGLPAESAPVVTAPGATETLDIGGQKVHIRRVTLDSGEKCIVVLEERGILQYSDALFSITCDFHPGGA